jgi:hypothetical protein
MKIKHIPALLVNAPSLAPGPCEAAASPPIRKAERRSACSERRGPLRRVPVASLLRNLASVTGLARLAARALAVSVWLRFGRLVANFTVLSVPFLIHQLRPTAVEICAASRRDSNGPEVIAQHSGYTPIGYLSRLECGTLLPPNG